MPLIVGLLIAALAAYVVYRAFLRPEKVSAVTATRSDRGFAFLSNGMIFFRERGGELKQLHSPYAQEAIDRRERSKARHSWKEGTTFNIAAGGRQRSFESVDKPLIATSAAYESNGSLLYFLKDDHMGGLFRREVDSGKELRLVLKQNFNLTDLNPSPDGTLLAASSQQSGGVANIDPTKLNETLGAMASALNDRGQKVGKMFSDLDSFLAKWEPSLPALRHDLTVLPEVSNAYADAAPDLLKTAANATRISKTLVDEQHNLDALLISAKTESGLAFT